MWLGEKVDELVVEVCWEDGIFFEGRRSRPRCSPLVCNCKRPWLGGAGRKRFVLGRECSLGNGVR